MSRCKLCGGSFKYTTKEHILKTRHEKNPERVIENLDVMECIICGHIVLPKSSEVIIDMIRNKVRKEMEDTSSYQTFPQSFPTTISIPKPSKLVKQTEKLSLDTIKETIRKIIG